MSECGTKVTVDTTEGDKALDQLEKHAEITVKSIMQGIDKTYQTMVLLGDVFGMVIPELFTILASGAIMAGEMFAELAAAETISGVLAVKAFVTFGLATIMFFRAMQIQQQAREVESSLHSSLMLLQLWS